MPQAKRLVIAFLMLIVAGAVLLTIPVMTVAGKIALIDACFTATSAVCVTGLTVLDTEHDFTLLGQFVILVLIQCGGIGIITIASSIILSSHKHLSLDYEAMLSSTVAISPKITFREITYSVIRLSLTIEFIGAMLLFVFWQVEGSFVGRVWQSLFHAISAFCNAGFSLYSDNLEQFTHNSGVSCVIMGLVILGGFGFVNLRELLFKWRSRQFKWRYFSLFLKVSITFTIFLNLLGTLLIFLADYTVAMGSLSLFEKLVAAAFHSASTRTAGFNTLPIANFTDMSLSFMIGWMFIGGVSGSCAGGVKVSSLAIVLGVLRSYLQNAAQPAIFQRRLPNIVQKRAVTLVFFSMACVMLGVVLFSITEGRFVSYGTQHSPFLGGLFEVVSALGTVGLSTGITPALTGASKGLFIVLMFIGRLGPLVIISAWVGEVPPKPFTYPEESLPVG
jgi:trk system potassium uptake protein TrkH